MAKINSRGGMEPQHDQEPKQEEVFTSSASKRLHNSFIDIQKAFSEEPEPLDFVANGFLAGTVGTLFSPGATGKSFLSLQLAIDVASGTDSLKLGIEKAGNVLYLAAEDPAQILTKRLYDIGKLLNPRIRKATSNNLRIAAIAGKNVNVHTDEYMQAIIETCADNTRLIVIDTISRVHTLEENSNSEMAQLLQALERIAATTKAAVLFLHHISKSTAISGAGDTQQAARGASVLTDNSRFGASLTTMGKKEAEQYAIPEAERRSYIRYCVVKNNYAAPIEDRWFKRVSGGTLVSIILDKHEPKQTKDEDVSDPLATASSKWEGYM